MIEEKLEYKPIPVKDLLRDLKNLSWLMTNLAFSAIIYGEKSLAEEVLELEKRVTYLEYLLIMQSSLATRNPRDAEKMVSIIKLAESIGRISNAAADIAYTSLCY
ncbi:MAG TPA: potassium channel protein, partial [Thermoproteales archaeon]|nr:potassium channel protein [Thermoproteales archaeon]